MLGGVISLTIGLGSAAISVVLGVVVGLLAGYRGGWFDAATSMVINIVIAFPFLVVIIIVVAVAGPGLQNIYIAVFLGSWTMYARLTRAEMLVERNKDYVQAAKVLGFPTRRVLLLRRGLGLLRGSVRRCRRGVLRAWGRCRRLCRLCRWSVRLGLIRWRSRCCAAD